MVLTNAERQAALKARREEMNRLLTEQNAKLLDENAALREEVAALREKAHRLEVSALKAQIAGARRPAETPPKNKGAPVAGVGAAPAKHQGRKASAKSSRSRA